MVQNDGQNLGFILSTPRSGSTLLSTILDNHSVLSCPNEPWLLLPFASLDKSTAIWQEASYSFSLSKLGINEFVPEYDFLKITNEAIVKLYNTSLNDGKSYLIDKTPRYIFILNYIEKQFPHAKCVYLKRNPLDVAASYMSTWNASVDVLCGNEINPYSFDFILGFRNLADFFSSKSDYKYIINYEDLVLNPKEEIIKLCEFLGISYQEKMEDYSQNQSALTNHANKSMGDKKILEKSAVSNSSVSNWKKLNNKDLQSLFNVLGADLFKQLGYQDTLHELMELGINISDSETSKQKYYQLSAFMSSEGSNYWHEKTLFQKANNEIFERSLVMNKIEAELESKSNELILKNSILNEIYSSKWWSIGSFFKKIFKYFFNPLN